MASPLATPIDLNGTRHHELIGSHFGLRHVSESLRLVAPTDTTVLIQGETGTGKELVAGAIHAHSHRNRGPLVKLNCSAIPAGLIESELFGHERGAFTGAVSRFIGRFQQAHGGTLFLDGIGDMPYDLQPKLLRVLQEQEFERLGSVQTTRVDVRVIAATNQNLRQMMNERRFRADLYYRLSVFPIPLPPLRERTEDIPLLVRHFADRYSRRMNKVFTPISQETMETFKRHQWSGNVRELENFVHRSVISSVGPDLNFPFEELEISRDSVPDTAPCTLAEAERAHILKVLKEVDGMIGGRNGAAARLGVARTTLLYRMRKLGI